LRHDAAGWLNETEKTGMHNGRLLARIDRCGKSATPLVFLWPAPPRRDTPIIRSQSLENKTDENPTLDAALADLRAGLSVIPIRRDGSKAPTCAWKRYQKLRATEAKLRAWFGHPDPPGIAILGGAVSGGLELLDFDVGAETIYPQWRELVEAERLGLLAKLSVVRTPRPGFHIRYRCVEIPIPGNMKLAVDPDLPEDDRCLIETRGEGGYALAPGSPAACHKSGGIYEHIEGPSLTDVRTITAAEREILLRVARSFDRTAQEERAAPAGANNRPGDDFNRRGPDWAEILIGWTEMRSYPDGKRYWRRPGKEGQGWSATPVVQKARRVRTCSATSQRTPTRSRARTGPNCAPVTASSRPTR
jgi:putative DNA primase/helicase